MRSDEVHTWPALSSAAYASASTALSRSASGATTKASLPPSSRWRCFIIGAATDAMRWPVATDPVIAITRTSGWATSASPASDPYPVTTLTTPGGKWSKQRSIHSRVTSEVSSDGLMTTVLPAASAGASFHAEQQQRVVPRHDGADDAVGLLEDQVELRARFRRGDHPPDAVATELGVVPQRGERPLGLLLLLGAGLALLAGQQLDQVRRGGPSTARTPRAAVRPGRWPRCTASRPHAVRAAATARSTSAAPPAGTRPMTSSVAGSWLSIQSVPAAATCWLSIHMARSLTDASLSVGRSGTCSARRRSGGRRELQGHTATGAARNRTVIGPARR